MRKRTTGLPLAYSHLDEAKRMAVARASPKTISRLSLVSSTSVLVGILCPPILSITHLGNRQEFFHGFSGGVRVRIGLLRRTTSFRQHPFYVPPLCRQTGLANLR